MAIHLSPPTFKPTQFSSLCTKPSMISSCSFKTKSKKSHPILITKLLGSRSQRFPTLQHRCSANPDEGSSELPVEDNDMAGRIPGMLEYCSVKKAFVSMVFMIRELQRHALHIREHLTREDLHVMMSRVQREMNASFLWLFQRVFSQTPTLMVYVMILMANFTVHSMTRSTAAPAAARYGAVTVTADLTERERSRKEVGLWDLIVEEALAMQAEVGGVAVDREAVKRFVSPLTVEVEKDRYEEYFRTELMYQIGIAEEPNNALLLANYAQFLYLVAHDHDRAEECFKRAVSSEPPDAEALGRYADFLWVVKKDLWEAEERYQQAMEVDPHNSHHSSKYANFLWSTGGVDTCFPLQSTDM